jgi:hypothetical protein
MSIYEILPVLDLTQSVHAKIFFLPSFSQNIQLGLNFILSGSRDLRRLLSKSLLPSMDGGGAGKRLRFIVNLLVADSKFSSA